MNRCIDHSRRQKFRRFIGLEEALEPEDPGQSPAAAAELRSEVSAVARLVLELPPRQRAAILVAAEGGQSSSEVAAVLGISTGAAEQLLVRARRTLRARLAAAETKGDEDDDR
jgi:RNA polymerase sigma-70 factor (ECF subfamily)